jgi:hypothetical protein
MVGISVWVCLDPSAGDDVVAAVSTAMAPFELWRTPAEELWQWDSWRIAGGHDRCGFHVVAGAEDDPRLVHDQPHWSEGPQPSQPGWCAGGPRGLLDLHRRARDAERAAGPLWDLYQRLRAELPPLLPLEHFVGLPKNQLPRVPTNYVTLSPGLQVNRGEVQARQQYDDQPIMRELRASPHWPTGAPPWIDARPSPFDAPRDAYVAARVAWTVRSCSLVTLDGWWVDPDYPHYPPVHGACDSWAACPHRDGMTDPWTPADIHAYLDRQPDDVIIVRLRGHA